MSGRILIKPWRLRGPRLTEDRKHGFSKPLNVLQVRELAHQSSMRFPRAAKKRPTSFDVL
jgi:hypothetical protein